MFINADFSRRAVAAPYQHEWVASPQAGVERIMLDRMGAETGRATSLVRYAAGSAFPRHQHPGGEEILVLKGTFCEGDTRYPAGWYLRNPPGSSHKPSSDEGAVLFVKLWQMPASECRSVRIDTRDPSYWTFRDGRESCLLFAAEYEQVSIERLAAGAAVFGSPVEGAEMLVLEGSLQDGAQSYPSGSWIRLPPGQYPDYLAGDSGVTLYLKTGHLSERAFQDGVPC